MLFALLLLSGVAGWVPMRWTLPDPKAIEILSGTPVNCILLENANWTPPLISAAKARGIAVLGVVRPGTAALDSARKAADLHLDGVVLEGNFEKPAGERIRSFLSDSKLAVIDLPSRAGMRFTARPVVGTTQGVWPGIQAEEDGKAKAAPSGAPWINTNGGFLRFVRAAAPDATIWLGNTAPANTVITPERYMQAVADAGIIGARWIVSLDADFTKRLSSGDANALRDWRKIADQMAWFEKHNEWRSMKPLSQLALIQDVDSGALYSGGVLDMIAVKHTPVTPVPTHKLTPAAMTGATMAVNVDPSSLSEEEKAALQNFRRSGGSTLNGPASWKFPPTRPDRITLSDDEVKTLDEIWKEMNSMTGRRNLGARLFNVSSMLSNLVESADGKHAVLHLVNYSGFPVENVTVHLLGKYKSATLIAPGVEPKKLQPYENEEGSGVDIDTVGITASLLLEE